MCNNKFKYNDGLSLRLEFDINYPKIFINHMYHILFIYDHFNYNTKLENLNTNPEDFIEMVIGCNIIESKEMLSDFFKFCGK